MAMLKGIPSILTPELLKILMEMGHSDELVIADGNFPKLGHPDQVVRLDGHGVPEILDAVLRFMPLDTYVEAPVLLMEVMKGDTVVPTIWEEYRRIIKEREENPVKIWESNIFGKSLHSLVNEGMHNKLYRMPVDAREKVRETIERIINDGCSGLLCIIL